MNRPIKFRAWDGKKMVRNFHISPDGVMLTEATGMKYDGLHETNSTIMQFCGLLDKNGKEIYEGDVLRVQDKESTGYDEQIGEVEWWPETSPGYIWGYRILWNNGTGQSLNVILTDTASIEVIGNIYENPELLATSII